MPVPISNTLFPDVPARQLLDAIDGIAYVVARHGTIEAVGGTWDSFAVKNGEPNLSGTSAVGRNLFDMIGGDDVRNAQLALHEAVCTERRANISYQFRCDGPQIERHMRMSMSPLFDDRGAVISVLYQSQILREVGRIPMPLFSSDLSAYTTSRFSNGTLVTICSYCHDVAWPPEASSQRAWIKPEDYYRRGGSPDVLVSHGICPPCYARVVEANLADETTSESLDAL